VIKGLLSPVGKSFARLTQTGDQRRTQEQVVVEDLPENIARIESYIQQIDRPPRQVLIEVHVLSVLLDDDTRHGVNFDAVLRLANANVTVATPGFANGAASPAFVVGIDSSDLDAVIESLQTTNDAKTLASPKVLAVNGQEARIQIGQRLGYRVTTTTQTSTQEDVNFLETGIVMTVTPIIGENGLIMMTVKPKVSDGRINPATSLP
jgi:type II secretory pathway component GspD/PulD (secretin)